MTSEAGYKIVKMEDRVTSEIPKPFTVRSDNRARKPGQYYYERNVLRRYPDDTKTVEDRGESYSGEASIGDRIFIGGSVRNGEQIVDGNANDAIGTMNQRRNESLEGDDVGRGLDEEAFSDEIETAEPRYR